MQNNTTKDPCKQKQNTQKSLYMQKYINIKKPLQVPELQGVFRAGLLAPDDKFNVKMEKWTFLHLRKLHRMLCENDDFG